MEEDDEDDEDDDKAAYMREYGWNRKLCIYAEVEALWQTYINSCLNYPKHSFREYVMKHYKTAFPSLVGADYLIMVWKIVKNRIFN